MDTNSPHSLEELIQRELSKLPERSAPNTLIPRVLAQIQAAEQKRWWHRPWSHWPLGMQIASVPLLLSGVGAAVLVLSMLSNWLLGQVTLGELAAQMDSLSAIWDLMSVFANAILVIGRAVGQQWLLLGLLIPMAMYAACLGLGTLCYRVAVYKR
jgi:hypothetical protein